MKKSVRFRITALFIGIIVFIIMTVCLVNHYFLQSFYEKQKISEMETAYAALKGAVESAEDKGIFFYDIFSGDDSGRLDIISTFAEKSNIDILIYDRDTGVYIGTSRENDWMLSKLETYLEFSDIMQNQLPRSMYQVVRETPEYTIQRTFDRRTGNMFLESWGVFSDSLSFIMSLPVIGIQESARIMNRFLLFVGIVMLIIGSVIVYFTTDALTKPLNSLASIAQRIASLDFSCKYEGNAQDEIGVLGNSMNIMSDKLSDTVYELTEANRKLQEDIDLKEKIDNMRKDFISNVSHELKTPIALIEGYAEGLCEGMAEDPETRDYYCGVIMDESRKMNRMVKSLTSLTNLEFGTSELNIEEFDLCELIKNTVSSHQLELNEKNAVLTLSLPETCTCLADSFKIEEVLTNYLTNAMNHLSGERRIIISVERIDVKTVRLSVYNDGENIPSESLERIWEKFYKVDKAHTREYGGSGIGLSIVKAIMEAHNKEYGVLNKESGVCFYATLDSVA